MADATPILPDRPIAERIAAYADGRERIRRLQEIGSDYRRLDDEHRAARGVVDDLVARRAKLKGAEKRKLKGALDEAEARLADLAHRRYKAGEAANARAAEHLATGGRFHLGAVAEGLSDDQHAAMAAGLRWMQRAVAPPPGGKGHDPADPVRVRMDPVPEGQPQRSFCIGGRVWLDRFADPATVVHEAGHWLDNNAAFARSAREFLAHRVGDEAPRPLAKVVGKGYRKDELGRKDRFEEAFGPESAWYVGKRYDNETASEITSMGMEMMYKDPVGFAVRDPEFATFILGLMHGPLR